MLPRSLIYDPELTIDVPLGVSMCGFNSISHAVSSYLGKDANPVANMYSEHGIRTMSAALVQLAENPRDIDARSNAMHGAWLCGMTLMSSGTTIHHKIAHVLGGEFRLTARGPPMLSSCLIRLATIGRWRRMLPAEIGRAFNVSPEDAPASLADLLGKSGAAEVARSRFIGGRVGRRH